MFTKYRLAHLGVDAVGADYQVIFAASAICELDKNLFCSLVDVAEGKTQAQRRTAGGDGIVQHLMQGGPGQSKVAGVVIAS
ncbi:hypothetical protein D3C76_1726310 [compost metagenome]